MVNARLNSNKYEVGLTVIMRSAQLSLILGLLMLMLFGCQQRFPPATQSIQMSSAGIVSADIFDRARLAVAIGYDEPTGFWDLAQGGRRYHWRHIGDTPLFARASSDASVVVLAGASRISLWQSNNGKNIGFYSVPRRTGDSTELAKVRDIAISNQGRHLAIALDDGRVVFVDTKSGRRLEFFGHLLNARKQGIPDGWAGVNSVDISGNGHYVLSGGDDNQALFWDTKTGQILQRYQHKNRVHLVRLDELHKRAFSASIRAESVVWDLASGQPVSRLKLKPREYVVSAVAFDASGQYIATGAPGRELKLWHIPEGKLVQQWRVQTRGRGGAVVLAVGFSDHGTLWSIASSGYAQQWKIP